jgi:hypothetical protein
MGGGAPRNLAAVVLSPRPKVLGHKRWHTKRELIAGELSEGTLYKGQAQMKNKDWEESLVLKLFTRRSKMVTRGRKQIA